ncbi:hypothetical protein AK812_SmicGene30167 [Symbiodinium microadriaticum]|uniref:Uncharacterized protein n=1 Tax=Symbiodinium microadriaticum TaxID=2951 RepID=A0A1Q9D001_SYMMI|nr:hypothetical protein AK812_SmicGene30167 [Symbiodinium microadriaticum]
MDGSQASEPANVTLLRQCLNRFSFNKKIVKVKTAVSVDGPLKIGSQEYGPYHIIIHAGAVQPGKAKLRKVKSTANPANCLTKHLPGYGRPHAGLNRFSFNKKVVKVKTAVRVDGPLKIGPEGLCHRVDDWERNVVARGVKFLTANDSQYRAISENSNFTALTADEENASNFTVFSLPGVGQYGKVMVAAFDSPSWILSTKIKWDSCSDHRSLQHYDADQKKAGVQSHKNQSFSPWTNGASLFGGDTSESEWGGYTHVGQVSWLDWWRINWFAGKHLDGIGYDGMSVKHERLALRSVDDSALPFDDRVALKLAWVDQPSGTIGVQFQSVLQTPEYLPCMDNLTSWSHTCLSAGTGRLAVSQPLELCGLLPHSRWQTQPRVRDSCCAKCELSILYLS